LKLQYTRLAGNRPFVRLITSTSRTWVAGGMAPVLPQNDRGGAPDPGGVGGAAKLGEASVRMSDAANASATAAARKCIRTWT